MRVQGMEEMGKREKGGMERMLNADLGKRRERNGEDIRVDIISLRTQHSGPFVPHAIPYPHRLTSPVIHQKIQRESIVAKISYTKN
jgi:hypothetical protein